RCAAPLPAPCDRSGGGLSYRLGPPQLHPLAAQRVCPANRLDDLEGAARFVASHEWSALTPHCRRHAGEHLGVPLGLRAFALGDPVCLAAEVASDRAERMDSPSR